jgi:hypothetical protein
MTTLHTVFSHMKQGNWLAAHNLVQDDPSTVAAWLHGILHIQEGDLEDAEYWYGLANRHFRSRGTLAQELTSFESELNKLSIE